MSIPTFDTIIGLLSFVVPGFVSHRVISVFKPRINEHAKEFIYSFLALSALNFAINFWVIPIVNSENIADIYKIFSWTWFVLFSPITIGLIIGIGYQKDWISKLFGSKLLARFNIRPIHHIPTAWDWKFSTIKGEWVLITLKNDMIYGGYCGSESFISSDLTNRDIYIEKIYIVEKEDWKPTNRSLFISSGEIRTIEFLDPEKIEDDDEQKT